MAQHTPKSSEDGTLARIGRHVRELRRGRGLTARVLAERAGLSVRFLSQLEAGRANIAVGRLDAVARALDVPLAALTAADDDEQGPLGRIQRLLAGCSPAELERARAALELALGHPRPRAIALLGLRGAGKSTLGPRLAETLGLRFVELDHRIEEAAGLSLGEVFALHGEAYYRRLEAQALAALLAGDEPCVVALGGGVVGNEEAFRLARDHCTTVWLQATPEDHMERVVAQGDRRPMADSRDAMAELRGLLAAREPLYRLAEIAVDTSASGERALEVLGERLAEAGWGARASTPPARGAR